MYTQNFMLQAWQCCKGKVETSEKQTLQCEPPKTYEDNLQANVEITKFELLTKVCSKLGNVTATTQMEHVKMP